MYRVYCDDELIYDPRDDTLVMLAGKVLLEVNKTGEFAFTLPMIHPKISGIHKLTSVIRVLDCESELYSGRVLSAESDLYGTTKFTCEGEAGYLLDSIQRPKSYSDLTPRIYLQDKLNQHNSQSDASKQFVLGNVELDTMNYDAREDNQYTNTLDTIMNKLVASNGGYIRVRHENGMRYLDYLKSYNRTSGQVIRFGENVLDLTQKISAEDIITVLIPLGKAPDGEKEGAKLTIESVNGGRDYIENTEAIALYGRIVGTNEWPDVGIPANLKSKGEEYLKNMRNLSLSIELSAIDLHLIDVDIDYIALGDMVRVVSPQHGLDNYMLVSRREYDLLNPEQDKLVLGDKIVALTDKQLQMQKAINSQKVSVESVESLKKTVSNVSVEVSSLDGKVQVIETGYASTKQEFLELKNNATITSKNIQRLETQHQTDVNTIDTTLRDITKRIELLEGGAKVSC